MSRTQQLFELQQVDSQSDDLLRRALAITQALGESAALRAARAAHDAAAAALAADQAQLRALSHEVDEISARLKTMSGRLYDGSVKNPKELVAIEHDMAAAKQVRAEREDQLLEAMVAVDGRQAEVEAAERELALVQTEWQRSQDGLLEEKDSVDAQLRVLRTRREKMIADIPWADLQLYERLRKAKHGVAVTGIEHDICQACRVKIPAGAMQTVRLGQELVYCPSCARLLYPGARGDVVRR